jgi:beta-phosphoglucomutase-like phosphatase (HAD superfamily)
MDTKLPFIWDYKAIFMDLNGTLVPDYNPLHGITPLKNNIKAIHGKLRYRLDADRFLIGAKLSGRQMALVSDVIGWIMNSFKKSPALNSAASFDAIFGKNIFTKDMWGGKEKYFGYAMALEMLGLKPDEVLCFEDSKKGITAAQKAKIDVCAINNPYAKVTNEDLEKSQFYIESFNNLM